MKRWDGPPIDAWDPWSPEVVAQKLAETSACWSVVGGWSIDLFLARETRAHHDIEIATIRPDLPEIRRALSELVFHAVGDGEVLRLAANEESPIEWHQHWLLDERAGRWRVDVMVEPGDAQRWVYRRDARVAAARREMIAVTVDGIPYLKPHGALLYKARSMLPKDEADFDAVVDHLEAPDRDWLIAALEILHSAHPWLHRLRRAGPVE